MLQVFQKDSAVDDDAEPAERYPDFEEHATWFETPNHNIFNEDVFPSLEIE